MVPLPRLFGRKTAAPVDTEPVNVPVVHLVSTPELLSAARTLFRTVPAEDEATVALIARCRDAADANPNLARAHLRLGVVLYETGRSELAAQSLTRATRLGRDSGLTNQHCALAHAALGCSEFASEDDRLEDGVAEFHLALGFLANTQDFAPASLKYAISLYKSGSSDIALETLREMMAGKDELFGTDRPLASCLLACCLVDSGASTQAALEAFQQTYALLKKAFNTTAP